MSVEEVHPSLYDHTSELFRRNTARLGARDVVIASTGGAGQSLLGNILLELGLNYVDPYTQTLDGEAGEAHRPWRRRLAATSRRDGSAAPRRQWPRFVKSEEPPGRTLRNRVGGICLLVRDPRDALYSRYRFRRDFARDPWALGAGSFEAWLGRAHPEGGLPVAEWREFYRQWLAAGGDGVPVVRFEDLKTEPERAVREFLGAFGVEVDDAALTAALERSRFEVMRRHEDKASQAESGGLAGARILRRGAVDEWREWLTPRLWAHFDDPAVRELAGRLGYRLRYP